MKKYFLGVAANYTCRELVQHTFGIGRSKDLAALENYLGKKYEGEAMLCKNGRSALAIALKTYFDPGDTIIVNGFTCYAVYEAVRAAQLKPLFVDIEKNDLNYSVNTLKKVKDWSRIKGIIIQNTLGNPIDIAGIEEFGKKHQLVLIEDLAHCAGVKYPDGREVGTVGAAVACSFGKDKSIDTISGGAVILRAPRKHKIEKPTMKPRFSDRFRTRFYPLFGWTYRGLASVHLNGVFMRCLLVLRMVEKSADSRLDTKRMIGKLQARLALAKYNELEKTGASPIREFYLVRDREQVLKQLSQAGYFFSGIWYEKPVSPERYYKKVHFPEQDCPNAVFVSKHIVNLPTYYTKSELKQARSIIKDNLEEGADEQE